jgi:hypothetical protein
MGSYFSDQELTEPMMLVASPQLTISRTGEGEIDTQLPEPVRVARAVHGLASPLLP